MADQADGRIIIDTAIDSKGFTADSAKLQRAVKSLSGKMEALGPTFQKAITGNSSAISSFEARSQSLKKTISELETELKALGERKYESAEYSNLLSDLDKVDAKLAQIDAQKAKLSALGDGEDTKRWKNLEYEADILLEKQKRLNAEKARFEASGTNIYSGAETERYSQLSEALENARSRLSEMTSQEQEAANVGSRFGSVLSAIASGAKKAVSALGRTAINAVKRFCSRIKQTNTASNSLVKSLTSLKTMLISRIKRMFISEIFSSAKDGINALARFSSEFDRTMSNIKNRSKETSANLSVSLGNIISTVEPFITRIAAAFSTAITYVNALFAALSGKSTVIVAKKQTESYAESLEDTANAAKDAKRQLAGFDELNILSNGSSSNSSVSELFEEVPIDSALPDDVKSFFDRIYEAITSNDWYGAGDITAEGLNSIVNRVDDWFNNTLRPKGKMWAGRFAEILNGMVAGFDWNLTGKTVADGLNAVFDIIHTFFTKFDFEKLGTGIGAAINNFFANVEWDLIGQAFGSKWNALVNLVYGIVTEIDWELVGDSFAEFVENLFETFNFDKIVDTLSIGINGIVTMLQHLFDGVDFPSLASDLASGINKLVSEVDWSAAGKMMSDGAKGLLDFIVTGLEEIDWQQIGRSLKEFLVAVDWKGIIEGISEGIGALLGGLSAILWELIRDAWNAVVQWWHDVAYEDGQFTMEGLLNGIWEKIKDIYYWIKEHIFEPFTKGFKKVFGIHSPSTKMAEMGKYIVEGLLNGIKSIWSSVTGFFSNSFSRIKSTISDAWNKVKSGTTTTWNNIKSSLSTTWNNIKSTASSKWDDIKSAIKNKGWSEVGTNICSGISSGIESGWSFLKEKVGSVASGLLDKAKDALGIHSPSRLFRNVVGLNIGYGIAEGIEASEKAGINAVANFADAIAAEANAGKYSMGGIIPTSEVDGALNSFADKISGSFTTLIDRLSAIAKGVNFTVPAVATGGIVPYSVSAAANGGNGAARAIEASNDELSSVVIQSVTNATAAIVRAIQDYSGTTVNLDIDSITTGVIAEINRKTRMTGKSPLQI